LARYNPCLACLGGISAVGGGTEKLQGPLVHTAASNLDGAVRDEDVFVVGDEDEDGDEDGEGARAPGMVSLSSPSEGTGPLELDNRLGPCADPDKRDEPTDSNQDSPGRYYIRPDDTLLGISLRLGVDVSVLSYYIAYPSAPLAYQGRTLCKLNDLPPSALRTTPHLLHTRTFLVLPQSHSQQRHAASDVAPEEEARHKRVRAQVALQHVTRETDGGIAQAYVALAEGSDSERDVASLKAEEEKKESRRVARTLEERALDRYLNDDEWERQERAEGRGVRIQRFPVGGSQDEKVGWRGRWGF
jgi:hypothetical protein